MSVLPDSEIWDSLLSMRDRIVSMGGARYGEDLFGEVCLKASRGKHSHPGSLYHIAKRTLIDFKRRDGRRHHLSLHSIPYLQYRKGPDPFHELERKEQGEIVNREVDKLRPHYGEIIRLYYGDNLTDQQSADRLGIPIDTARTRKKRAKKQLEASLQPLR